jgi:hypothetical protein
MLVPVEVSPSSRSRQKLAGVHPQATDLAGDDETLTQPGELPLF